MTQILATSRVERDCNHSWKAWAGLGVGPNTGRKYCVDCGVWEDERRYRLPYSSVAHLAQAQTEILRFLISKGRLIIQGEDHCMTLPITNLKSGGITSAGLHPDFYNRPADWNPDGNRIEIYDDSELTYSGLSSHASYSYGGRTWSTGKQCGWIGFTPAGGQTPIEDEDTPAPRRPQSSGTTSSTSVLPFGARRRFRYKLDDSYWNAGIESEDD